ncbi:MAG: phosphoribosylpyrophosphate synthetase [Chitinophagaceae bacterium]|nr:MAG: phosphoribosylpyrophosphate synthetase [Chitinophagaceae bacterium]
MHQYDTVVAALNGLKERGYTLDFNIAFDKLTCRQNDTCLNPGQFEITEVHRFEGFTNPSDEDVVYAVEAKEGSLKGVIHSAFGTYADPVATDMLRKLSMNIH